MPFPDVRQHIHSLRRMAGGGRWKASLKELNGLVRNGHVRIVTPSQHDPASALIVTVIQISGDAVVSVSRTWLQDAPPNGAFDVMSAHFNEVQDCVDKIGDALRSFGPGIVATVLLLEIPTVFSQIEMITTSFAALTSAGSALAAGDFAIAAQTAGHLVGPTLGGFFMPLALPAAGWVVRKAISIWFRRNFLDDKQNTRTKYRFNQAETV